MANISGRNARTGSAGHSSRAARFEMEAILLSLWNLTDCVHCCVGKSRNIDIFAAPFFLALNEIASNLVCVVYECTALAVTYLSLHPRGEG